MSEQRRVLRAEDDAGWCPERQHGDLPVRTVGEGAVGVVDDGDPPAGPLERAWVGDGDHAEVTAGEPALPRSERVRRRQVVELRQLGERHFGDRGQARGQAAHEWAGRSVGQVDLDHVGSEAVAGIRTGSCVDMGSGVVRRPPR